MHGYRSTRHGPRSTRHADHGASVEHRSTRFIHERAREHRSTRRRARARARSPRQRTRCAEHEAQSTRRREHESTRRGARGAERARGEEHEALSAKCGAEEHGARGTEHEARSTRYGAQSTPRGAERKAQSTSEARSTMNERSPPKCTEQNARTFLFRAGAFCKRCSEKVYPIWVALKSPHHTQKIFKKITPFGTRRKVRNISDRRFTPRDRYTFPICGYIRIVNVPAQVARAQEGSLLRRLECLSCPVLAPASTSALCGTVGGRQ